MLLLNLAYHYIAKEMPFFCYKASEAEPMSFYVAVSFILASYLA